MKVEANDENKNKSNEDDVDIEMNGGGYIKKLNVKQMNYIQSLIKKCETQEEIDKLQRIIQTGKIPHKDWKKMNSNS